MATSSGGQGLTTLLVGRPLEVPLVAAFREVYPVVTLGRPGERLPALGAARLYLNDDGWRRRVEELIASARLVIVVAGASPGLLWEVQAILQAEALRKTVLYVPIDPNRRAASLERWQTFRETLHASTTVALGDLPARLATDAMILLGASGTAPGVRAVRVVRPDHAGAHRQDQEARLRAMAHEVLKATAA